MNPDTTGDNDSGGDYDPDEDEESDQENSWIWNNLPLPDDLEDPSEELEALHGSEENEDEEDEEETEQEEAVDQDDAMDTENDDDSSADDDLFGIRNDAGGGGGSGSSSSSQQQASDPGAAAAAQASADVGQPTASGSGVLAGPSEYQVKKEDEDIEKALFKAVELQQVDRVRVLVPEVENQDRGVWNGNNSSPLVHWADLDQNMDTYDSQKHQDILNIMIDGGVNIDSIQKWRTLSKGNLWSWEATALHVAAMNGYIDLVRMLLEKGADATKTCKRAKNNLQFESTARQWAQKREQLEVVKLIDEHIETNLTKAIKNGDERAVRRLFPHVRNIARPIWNGLSRNPLIQAIRRKDIAILKFLIEAGANINSVGKSKKCIAETMREVETTALHFAAFKGLCDSVQLLLESGADFKISCMWISNTGKQFEGTARDWAEKAEHHDVVDIMEKYLDTLRNDTAKKVEDDMKALESKLKAAKEYKELMAQSDVYLDDNTYGMLDTQLQLMRMEGAFAKAKQLREDVESSEAECSKLTTDEFYLTPAQMADLRTRLDKAHAILEKIEVNDKKRKAMETSSDYVDVAGFRKMAQEIESKRRRLEAAEDKSVRSLTLDKADMECVVCYDLPKGDVWSCADCENIICCACRSKLKECPTCRAAFNANTLRRNRTAERILQKIK